MSKLSSRLKSPWVLLLGATLLAALVAYMAYAYLQQREARIKREVAEKSAKARGPKASVVVPSKDVQIGQVVTNGLFVSREIDADLVYADVVTVSQFDSIKGQKLARAVQRGRPLRLTDLQAPEIRDVASIVPEGQRAITIEIDDVNSIAQTLRPGHRVDVFLLTKLEKGDAVKVPDAALHQVSLFMQNLPVMATGKEFQNLDKAQLERVSQMKRPGEVRSGAEGYGTVTLQVTPTEAERLLVGQKLGSFRIALRGKEDENLLKIAPMTGGDVMYGPGGKAQTVEFIVGGKLGGGNAGLVPTMVPVVGQGGTAQSPKAGADNAQIRAGVEQALREMTNPRTNRPQAEAPSSTN